MERLLFTLKRQKLLDGSHSYPNVASYSFLLGTIGGVSLCFGLLSNVGTFYFAIGFYAFLLCLFHYMEYFLTAIWRPGQVSLSSFLINHSFEYHVAHTASLMEAFTEIYFFPRYKVYILSFTSLVGLAIAIIGIISRNLATWTAGSNFSHDIATEKKAGHKLVTNGIYRYIRHPSYFGFTVWVIGSQLLLGNILCFTAFTVVVWYYFRDRIEYEEELLIDFFGKEYLNYKKNTFSGILGIS